MYNGEVVEVVLMQRLFRPIQLARQ